MSVSKYFLRIAYNGSLYRGAAKQSGRNSVCDIDSIQGMLETAALTACPPPNHVFIYIASRTDSGVHALDTPVLLKIIGNQEKRFHSTELVEKINHFMVSSKNPIRVLECIPVSNDLHIGNVVTSRTYLYRFMVLKDPRKKSDLILENQRTYHLRGDSIELERMEKAMQLFMGRKNFMTFAAAKETRYPIVFERSLNELRLEKAQALAQFDPLSDNYNFWHIVCSARAFLYQQVRRIVGALFALAQGKITEKDIHVMLTVPSHKHFKHARPAPPYGLYLLKTEYNHDVLHAHMIKEEIHQSISAN